VDIALEAHAEERPQDLEDLRHVAAEVASVDRLVILVDENDDLLAMVPVEVAGQVEERSIIDRLLGGAVEDRAEVFDLPLIQPASVEEVEVLSEQDLELLSDSAPAIVEVLVFEVLERQINDRVSLEVGAVRAAGAPDG
jgi:hypothetical protein